MATETQLLTKMKAVTVKTQRALLNINNFLGMRQQIFERVWLYFDCLKGAAQHCNFTLFMGEASYIYKMVMHTLVHGP